MKSDMAIESMIDIPFLPKKKISADTLLERIPTLAISEGDSAVDSILYEVMGLLLSQIGADIGQINLLPKGGRVEKLCIMKDGLPWSREGIDLRFFDPSRGYTGIAVATGKSILVNDIWVKGNNEKPNPFLELLPTMNKRYVDEIKRPVASTIIVPIKRGNDIFCTIEMSRYRERERFRAEEKVALDDFAERYGALIMDYVLDVKNRIAINTAHEKLLNTARLISSNTPVDYRDVVEPYTKLSAADIVVAFFKTGGLWDSSFRVVASWGEDIREMLFLNFVPSEDSILRDDRTVHFPVEGEEMDERMVRFIHRIEHLSCLNQNDRTFLLKCAKAIKSYVAYPLHLLSQELGSVILGSRQPEFWQFLHMNPFLSLYHSLLRSFLINERVIHYLSDISLKIHNPGFYCLGALKGALLKFDPLLLRDVQVSSALKGLEELFDELHDQGRVLRWRIKEIHFTKWLQTYVNRKEVQYPGLKIHLKFKDQHVNECLITARDEQLETIFENLFSNSIRAIAAHQSQDRSLIGEIHIDVDKRDGMIEIAFGDNGTIYNTVSGRGVHQITREMEAMGGGMDVNHEPYRTFLHLPSICPK